MSGVSIVGMLLMTYAPLVAAVPAARIKAGALPQNVALPAIVVSSVHRLRRATLAPGAVRHVVTRVQVTVHANSEAERSAVLGLVRSACSDRQGDFAGATAVSVIEDLEGPDFTDTTAAIFMRSQDFVVSCNEAA